MGNYVGHFEIKAVAFVACIAVLMFVDLPDHFPTVMRLANGAAFAFVVMCHMLIGLRVACKRADNEHKDFRCQSQQRR